MFRTMSRDPDDVLIALARLAGHSVRREIVNIAGQEVKCVFISDRPEDTIDMEEILSRTNSKIQ